MKVKKNTKLYYPEYKYSVNHILEDKIYDVLCVEFGHYRILNECGDPALFPSVVFDIIESTLPPDWVIDKATEEEYEHDEDRGNAIAYIGPKEFLSFKYFFVDFFDDNKDVFKILLTYLYNRKYNLSCSLKSNPKFIEKL